MAPLSYQRSAAYRRRAELLDLSDFSGGLNVRDGYAEVAPNELRDGTLNVTLDERAALTTRKGCPAAADFPTLPGTPNTIFYSQALNLMLIQVSNTLYKCAPGGGAWVAFRTVAGGTASFADFLGKAVYTESGGVTRSYDGATDALVSALSGNAIAIWQNKPWVASVATPTRLYFPDTPGSLANFNSFVDLREKDDKPIIALFGGPTLIAFKETSHYRINDSATGSFSTVDWNSGAVGPRAVIGGVAPQASGLIQEGGIFFWGLDGLYAGDGLRPAILVGDKLRPRFINYSTINGTTKPLISAGIANGRVYFAFPKTLTTYPDTVLEYHPRERWLLEHQIGTVKPSGFASYATATRQVTVMADAAGTKLIELNSSDTRTDYDASPVALTVNTGFIPIAEGRLARMRKAVFTITAAASSAITLASSYLDANLGTELSDGLSWGSKTLPAGTSETTWNATGRAPAFSFTLTTSGVLVTLRRILAKFYPTEF